MNGLNLSRCAISFCAAATVLAGCGGSQQSVGSPATNAVAPAQVPARRPTEAEWDRWRSMILGDPDPGYGCLEAIYPERQWRETRCVKAPNVEFLPAHEIRPQEVGGGGNRDYFAEPIGDRTTAAIGWFPNVSGVSSEHSCCGTYNGTDYYSLQLNTNAFETHTCPNSKCEGWEQFVFLNEGDSSDGSLYIQYWLINYATYTGSPNCPDGWDVSYHGGQFYSCKMDSDSQDVQAT